LQFAVCTAAHRQPKLRVAVASSRNAGSKCSEHCLALFSLRAVGLFFAFSYYGSQSSFPAASAASAARFSYAWRIHPWPSCATSIECPLLAPFQE
jgi:hypothetical protein